jgi:PAS domain S-box-containing protein
MSRNSEALRCYYETILRYANDIFLLTDADERIIDANERAASATGYTRHELLGMQIGQLYALEKRTNADKQWQFDEQGTIFEAEFLRKDGSTFPVEISAHIVDVEGKKFRQAIIRNISERKQAELAILDEKRFSDTLIQSLPDIFFLLDQQAGLLQWNKNLERLFGLTSEAMAGTDAMAFVCEEDRPRTIERLQQAFETGTASTEARLNLTNGLRNYALTGTRIETKLGVCVIGLGIDITDRKRAQDAIDQEKAQAQTYLDIAEVIIGVLDVNGDIRLINRKGRKVLGYQEKELIGKNWFALCIPEDVREETQAVFRQLITGDTKPAEYHENKVLTKAGIERTIAFHNTVITEGETPTGIIFSGEDITERKTIEKSVRESRDLLRSVVENAPVRIFWKDMELRYLGCNTAFARDAGMSHPKDLYGKDDSQMGWREQADMYRADDRKVMESGKPKIGFEEPQTTPDGETIWLRTSKVPLRNANGEIAGLLGIYEDITAKKQNDSSLLYLNRALKTLGAVDRALVHSDSEDQLFQGVCRAIVEEGGYLLAWIGYAEHDAAKSVKVMASHAVQPGYTDKIHISWGDVPEGRGPAGKAIRSGKTQCIQNIAHSQRMQPWREQAHAYGYQAGIALPLSENGKPFGLLAIYATEADAFDAEEIALLEEMAGDLGYGIHMLHVGDERDRSRAEQQHTLEELRDSLENTVRVIASTVGKRDAYTAGHQRRVADLATTIAQEMGLPDEQIQGIHFAGIIHDLGKINIPAEILAKPGKLSAIEYQLMKSHPQSGYDILKDVAFPWPIADIVLQHHERLDGSGYPQGLKGDQILLEARIMAVADVVEAMSSHRPYRPGLGIEVALQEIEQHKGVRYDSTVVDACLKLFREKSYKLA